MQLCQFKSIHMNLYQSKLIHVNLCQYQLFQEIQLLFSPKYKYF
jgi:hypothetical protein